MALALCRSLCRIAANEPSFLSYHLRIQDQRDKHKLNIKALDAVLFGPPSRKEQSLPVCYVSFIRRCFQVRVRVRVGLDVVSPA